MMSLFSFIRIATLAILFLGNSILTHGQNTIPANELQSDFQVLKEALTSLHPGLYRYNTKVQMDENFDELEQELQNDLTRAEAYMTFSKFLARIRCGHTYCNFWNQPEEVKKEVIELDNKLPFHFRIIDQKIIITKNASSFSDIARGTEIVSIDGNSAQSIIDELIQYIKADGSNDGKRIKDLELNGSSNYEVFDIYYPLLFPPRSSQYEVTFKNFGSNDTYTKMIKTVGQGTRQEILTERYGKQVTKYDDLWNFEILENSTAYLQLGTFVTWNMEMNWKGFLKDSFKKIKEENIQYLILDIRGNEGGADEVYATLGNYLLSGAIQLPGSKDRLKYQKVPESIAPYVSTWDNSIFDWGNKVLPTEDGYFTWRKGDEDGSTYKPKSSPYKFEGKTYLLINAANSSATFLMSRIMQQQGVATLVGQTTGGNQRGINGGMMFFLTLPYSKIEMDIPLIASYPLQEMPDAGLEPDIFVKGSIEDVANEIDTEVEFVKELIEKSQKSQGVSINERLEEVAQKNWDGSLTYLDYGDNKTLVELPCNLSTSMKGDKLKTKIVFEEKKKNGDPIVHQNAYSISADQKYLIAQDKWEIVNTEQHGDECVITAISKGKDNNKSADFRLTLSISSTQFMQKKEVKYEGSDTYFTRNEYRFND